MGRLTNIGLTQQASVRRGPRASATYLLTVLLAESKADAFFRNGVCVSPKILEKREGFRLDNDVLAICPNAAATPLLSFYKYNRFTKNC